MNAEIEPSMDGVDAPVQHQHRHVRRRRLALERAGERHAPAARRTSDVVDDRRGRGSRVRRGDRRDRRSVAPRPSPVDPAVGVPGARGTRCLPTIRSRARGRRRIGSAHGDPTARDPDGEHDRRAALPERLRRARRCATDRPRTTSTGSTNRSSSSSIVDGARTLARFIADWYAGARRRCRPSRACRSWSRSSSAAAGEHVADRLVTAIALGEFVPGQRLPSERELASTLGVSRTTIREAIQRLAALGYVEVRRGRTGGAFVLEGMGPEANEMIRRTLLPEWSNLEGLLDFRQLIEPLIARTAACADRGRGRGRDPRRAERLRRRRRRSRGVACRRPGGPRRDRQGDREPVPGEPERPDPPADQPGLRCRAVQPRDPCPRREGPHRARRGGDRREGHDGRPDRRASLPTDGDGAARPGVPDRSSARTGAAAVSPRARYDRPSAAPGDPGDRRDEHLRVPDDPPGARATRCRRCSGSGRPRRTSRRSARSSGLDRPLLAQYLTWAGGAAARELRAGLHQPRAGLDAARPAAARHDRADPAVDDARGRWSAFRSVSGRRRGPAPVRQATEGFVVAGIAITDFWLGIMLVLLFAGIWQVLPPSGYVPFLKDPVAEPPVPGPPGARARVRRGRLHPAHHARRDGGGARHPVRPVPAREGDPRSAGSSTGTRSATPLPPIVTVIGIQFGVLLGGAIVIESLFALPGVGRLIVTSIQQRNYVVVQGGRARRRDAVHPGDARDRPDRRMARPADRRGSRVVSVAVASSGGGAEGGLAPRDPGVAEGPVGVRHPHGAWR